MNGPLDILHRTDVGVFDPSKTWPLLQKKIEHRVFTTRLQQKKLVVVIHIEGRYKMLQRSD